MEDEMRWTKTYGNFYISDEKNLQIHHEGVFHWVIKDFMGRQIGEARTLGAAKQKASML